MSRGGGQSYKHTLARTPTLTQTHTQGLKRGNGTRKKEGRDTLTSRKLKEFRMERQTVRDPSGRRVDRQTCNRPSNIDRETERERESPATPRAFE